MKNRGFSQDPSPLYLFTNRFFDNLMFQMWRKHLNECVDIATKEVASFNSYMNYVWLK